MSTGHIRSSASRTSGAWRSRSRTSCASTGTRALSASVANTLASTCRRPALCSRKRRLASATIAWLWRGREAERLQAVADAHRAAQRALPVVDGLGEHLGHAQVALDPGGERLVAALDARRRWCRRGGRRAPPAPRRPRRGSGAPARCSRGTAGSGRRRARPGPRAGSGACRGGRRRGAARRRSCRCRDRPARRARRAARRG